VAKAYRVVARLKNNRLWSAITQQWPDVRSQSDAARRLLTSMETATLPRDRDAEAAKAKARAKERFGTRDCS